MKFDTRLIALCFFVVSIGVCATASKHRHGGLAKYQREGRGNLLRKSNVVGGSPHGSSEKLLGKLRELNLLELASVPGITNPSLLEVSLSPSACLPVGMPGMWKKVPQWLLDPEGPLSIRTAHLPEVLPWLIRFLRASTRDEVTRIATAPVEVEVSFN